MQSEVATRDFMDQFRRLIRGSIASVKPRCLELIQTWAMAFEGKPRYNIVPETYNILRMEGHVFPEHNPSGDAMFVAEVAPEWLDGHDCYSCRSKFTTLTRKHHCRKCGQVFCAKCSSKTAAIPKFGIDKAVRVCDYCHGQLQGTIPEGAPPPVSRAPAAGGGGSGLGNEELSPEEEVRRFVEAERRAQMAAGSGSSNSGGGGGSQSEKERREQELKEREEMELAMALSMSENESNQTASRGFSDPYNQASAPDPSPVPTPSKPQFSSLYGAQLEEASALGVSDDPMAEYLGIATSPTSAGPASGGEDGLIDLVIPLSDPADVKTLSALRSGLELFEQKLIRAKQRGGGVYSDRTLQQMFRSLSLMHPELVSKIDGLEDDKGDFLTLKEKLEQIRTTWGQLEDAKREQIMRAEEQRKEQEILQKLQLEQKMKLIARQEEEKQAYMRDMEERIRLQEMEQRRANEERALAQQQAEMAKQAQMLAAQQEQLRLRRQEAEAAHARFQHYQGMPGGPPQGASRVPPSDAMRIHQMHMAAEEDRSQQTSTRGQYRPQPPFMRGPVPGAPGHGPRPPQPNVNVPPRSFGPPSTRGPQTVPPQSFPPRQGGPPPQGGPPSTSLPHHALSGHHGPPPVSGAPGASHAPVHWLPAGSGAPTMGGSPRMSGAPAMGRPPPTSSPHGMGQGLPMGARPPMHATSHGAPIGASPIAPHSYNPSPAHAHGTAPPPQQQAAPPQQPPKTANLISF